VVGRLGCVTMAGVGMSDDALGDAFVIAAVDFDTFFARHHPDMVRALTLAVGDVELGRDAAAEGFARALQRWSKVSTYDNPTGWVYRVGLNWARSRARKTRRERVGMVVDREQPAVEPLDAQLFEALRELSLDHRAVVVGHYYLDWSEAQLAAALDVAPGTVKSRLSRALTQLAALMENEHDRP
jgi:RNA polymerase sigma-70 factor, ECF subfamily